MMKIFKYPIGIHDKLTIRMPEGAKVLCVQTQKSEADEVPCIWALVDDKAPTEERTFLTFGTGHPIEKMPGDWIGTYQLEDGALVFHVFEELKQ